MVSSKRHLFIAPVHSFAKLVQIACPGTHFYRFDLGQSEVALKVGRAQDQGLWVQGVGFRACDWWLAILGIRFDILCLRKKRFRNEGLVIQRFEDLGSGVLDLVLCVARSELWNQGLGFQVSSFGIRIEGSGLRVQDLGFRDEGSA